MKSELQPHEDPAVLEHLEEQVEAEIMAYASAHPEQSYAISFRAFFNNLHNRLPNPDYQGSSFEVQLHSLVGIHDTPHGQFISADTNPYYSRFSQRYLEKTPLELLEDVRIAMQTAGIPEDVAPLFFRTLATNDDDRIERGVILEQIYVRLRAMGYAHYDLVM